MVERFDAWIGLRAVWTDETTRGIEAKRPERFFNPEQWPDTLTLELVPPRVRATKIDEDRVWLKQEIGAIESDCANERRRKGTRALGIPYVLSRGPGDFPKKHEAKRVY